MRGFTFLLLLATTLLSGLGCTSDNILTYEVPVETYPPLWVDSFIQPDETDGYDILWVIDRSGSMNNHDTQLLLGLEEMLTSLPITTSWRLGIISADPDEALSNSTFPLVPGDDIVDATDALNALGTGYSSWGEAGFEAVHSYMELGAYSSTWMRNTAALLVVFVSDEDEQSFSWTAATFADWITSIRSRVYVASIVGLDESSCADQVGEAYLELARDFNGVEVDICDDDWTTGVEQASKAYEPIEEIELTFTPVIETITVFIDEAQIAESAWDYDQQINTVFFTTAPDPGALVEVTYGIDSQA